jgi:hypothetical protein
MSLTLKITIFVLALVVTGVLFYLSLAPTYVLQISVEPDFVKGVDPDRDKAIVIYGGREPIYFDLTGSVSNPNTSDVVLKIHGPRDETFTELKPFPVSNGRFIGVVKLGSAESPIVSDVNYTYDLYSANDGSRLSVGHIQSQVKAVILGTIPWWMVIIGAIGLLASFLQVFQFIYTERANKSRLPSPQPSER